MGGLEPSIGWLHEFTGAQTRESAVYDLMEPFRWIGDLTTIEAFESGVLDLKDFYFMGDDYRYHIDTEAKRRFLGLLKDRFNTGVEYKGKPWKWDTIIVNKTQDLARFLVGKSEFTNLIQPAPHIERKASQYPLTRTVDLSLKETCKLGICNMLHGVRAHTQSDRH